MFENIKRLHFSKTKVIQAMYSVEGERIEFVKEINPVKKPVEDWMNKVEN